MKRTLLLLLGVGLVLGPLGTAEAGKGKRVERTVQGSYDVYPAPVTGCNAPLGSFACMVVHPRPSEAFFTANVKDAHGQPVYVEVTSGGRLLASFCGTTAGPVAVQPRAALEFDVGVGRWFGRSSCPTNQLKTTGTIRVTLSNQR